MAGEPADKKHLKRKEKREKGGQRVRQDRGKKWRGGRERGMVEGRRGRGRGGCMHKTSGILIN